MRSLGAYYFNKLNLIHFDILFDLMIVARCTKALGHENALLLKDMSSMNDQKLSLVSTGCLRKLHLKRFTFCPRSQLNWC